MVGTSSGRVWIHLLFSPNSGDWWSWVGAVGWNKSLFWLASEIPCFGSLIFEVFWHLGVLCSHPAAKLDLISA